MTLPQLQTLADELKQLWKLSNWAVTVKWMPEEQQEVKGTVYWGRCNWEGNNETADIEINPNQSSKAMRHTLYHEMVHLRLEGHNCDSFYERGIDLIAGELCQ